MCFFITAASTILSDLLKDLLMSYLEDSERYLVSYFRYVYELCNYSLTEFLLVFI